jgi:chaperonin GroES
MLGSRVLIEEIVEDVKSESGIILGTTEKSPQRVGTVISVGDSVEEIKVNDKVMFDGHRVAPLDFDGKTYLIMEENNVIGVYL